MKLNKLLASAILIAGLNSNAIADECGDVFSEDFWRSASVEDVQQSVIKVDGGVNMRDCDGNTPLYMAVRYFDASDDRTGVERVGSLVIQTLIDAGANVLAKNRWNVSPLHSVKDAAIARLLINAGAEVNPLDYRANTPLYYAASSDNLPLIKVLIDAGADPDGGGTSMTTVYDAQGKESKQIALASGRPLLLNQINPEALSLLISAGANVNIRGSYGQTPLHLVEDLAAAKLLIDAGADVNLQDDSGNTPLHDADNPDITRLLIGAGAKINQKNNQGGTPFHEMFGPYRLSPSLSSVQMWIGAGVDVNEQDGRGMTVLHGAVDDGDPQIVMAIINAGADVNLRSNSGVSLLHKAAAGVDSQLVQTLINAGAAVNALDDEGNSPLLYATVRGPFAVFFGGVNPEPLNLSIVQVLIDAGADVNVKSNQNITPLGVSVSAYSQEYFFALFKSTVSAYISFIEAESEEFNFNVNFLKTARSIVKALIKSGADVNVRNEKGAILLSALARSGELVLVRLVLDAGAEVHVRDEDGLTPLHLAALRNTDMLVVRALIDAGADINSRAKGFAPVHFAVANPNPQVIQVLIDAGADINAVTDDGKTPLDFANEGGNSQVIQLLQALGAKTGSQVNLKNKEDEVGPVLALIETNTEGCPDVTGRKFWSKVTVEDALRCYIRLGLNVNAKDKSTYSPLHKVVNHKVAQALIEAGANVNVKTRGGLGATPLHYAAERGNNALVTVLVKAGADVNARGGGTPLMWASRQGHVKILQVLIDAGANVDATNGLSSGNGGDSTALHLARDVKTVQLLIEAGARTDVKNAQAMTPLHVIMKANKPSPQVIQALIDAGAEVNSRDGDGNTPLILATRNYYSSPEIIKPLIEAGADINAKNTEGQTALDVAQKKKKTAIIEILIAAGAKKKKAANKQEVNDNDSTSNEAQKIIAKANSGDVRAQFKLGWVYLDGNGVDQSSEEAVLWWAKAAKNGHAGAQTELAWMYLQEDGVDYDLDVAVFWLKKAASQDHKDAIGILKGLTDEGLIEN
jgi:ankyrin repeat protein